MLGRDRPVLGAAGSGRGGHGSRLNRRRALAAAAGAVGAAVLSGCGTASRPIAGSRVVTLVAALDVPATDLLGTPAGRTALYQQVLRQFTAAHRGLAVRVVPYTPTAAKEAAILAGTGPDVFGDAAPSYPGYVQQNLLLSLNAYLRRDNLSLSLWSPTVVKALQTAHGVFAMSRGLDSYVFALNLSLFDRLGVAYPAPTWTHAELAAVAARIASHRGGSPRYGVQFQGGPAGFLGALQTPMIGFGGSITNTARTRQTLSSPASIRGATWLVDSLLSPGIGTIGGPSISLLNGNLGIQEIQQVDLLSLYQQWRSNFKWVLLPPPVYPVRRSGGAAANFWAISGSTRQPEAAWTLLTWLGAGTTFERFYMKAFLMPPALNRLMPEWQATVAAVVPGLKGKGIEWFTQSTQHGWGVAEPWFAYANTQVQQVDATWWGQLRGRQVSVSSALKGADQQANALMAAQASQPIPSLHGQQAALQRGRKRLGGMFAAGAQGISGTG